jgi:uncharacterized Zn-binding protein involved in type VI secretion
MTAIVRITDSLSTGHPCDGTTTLGGTNTDNTVIADGLRVAVIGAPTVSHDILVGGVCVPHVHQLIEGSPNVFVNGIAVGRIGDAADAGNMTSGASNVYVNGE